ncbi:MAG: hypothetical protein R3A47_08165 [Polyangiales bacterium]
MPFSRPSTPSKYGLGLAGITDETINSSLLTAALHHEFPTPSLFQGFEFENMGFTQAYEI